MKRRGSGYDIFPQIAPIGIERADQIEFPCARPMFDVLFALNGGERGGMLLVIRQHFHTVLPTEALDEPLAMLIDATKCVPT